MHSALLLLFAGLLVLASPTPPSFQPSVSSFLSSLCKRDPPIIGEGLSEQQKKQAKDGARDALQLAYYALTPGSRADDIFAKWFNPDDRETVNKVFIAMLGDNPEDGNGNALLGNIEVVPDYEDPDDGEYACDGSTSAEMRDAGGKNPEIIICPKAGYGHGGLSKDYDGVKAISCSEFDSRVSWKMESLGSIFVHEFTHYDLLMKDILPEGTDDVAYGPYLSQQLNREEALRNADSYSWFANELHWSTICAKDYGKPTKSDGEDPMCLSGTCEA